MFSDRLPSSWLGMGLQVEGIELAVPLLGGLRFFLVHEEHEWLVTDEHGLIQKVTAKVITSDFSPPFCLVIGLHGGALLGVVYRATRRVSPTTGTAISSIQYIPGFGHGAHSSFTPVDDAMKVSTAEMSTNFQNFELYRLSNIVQQYIVISSIRPQYRYLGDVAIPSAVSRVWHRRQLFVVTPTAIECVFVDAGVPSIDLETIKKKEELKAKEAHARAVAEHGELALIAVDGPKAVTHEKIPLRPPLLQV
ncbi:hypothetical protein AMTR_s00027p00057390 [Amborella trichopoda]|uniref:Uncharacterized protein n=1 Tax=Amborella trichopoda TaxID=13333 RepID=W1PSP3_AMBTC|nr:hypothetical protein AMTR_s00027p00057390 [Amborella trichopoda]